MNTLSKAEEETEAPLPWAASLPQTSAKHPVP